jgi:hypothetical protein
VNKSSISNSNGPGVVYIFIVIINLIVNIIRGYLDLFGICGNKGKYAGGDQVPEFENLENNSKNESGSFFAQTAP